MTDKNKSEIIFILDDSGSMRIIQDDSIGGFNTFLEEQLKIPGGEMTLVLFSSPESYRVVFEKKPLGRVPKLTPDVHRCGGHSTALLDAIGRTVTQVGERYRNTPEDQKPGTVILAILTDGLENSSQEFSRAQVKALLEEQQTKWQWKTVYLGANQDAFQTSRSMGMKGQSFTYTSTDVGTRNAYEIMSSSVTKARTQEQ